MSPDPKFKNTEVRSLADEATSAIENIQKRGEYDTDRWVGDRLHPAAVLGLLIYVDELEEALEAYQTLDRPRASGKMGV